MLILPCSRPILSHPIREGRNHQHFSNKSTKTSVFFSLSRTPEIKYIPVPIKKMPETKFFSQTITLSPHSSPSGLKFPAKLAYRTIGSSSTPAILLPTCFGGLLSDTLPFLYSGENAILPPSKYFIIITALLGGGESSSPSNTPEPYHGPNFPRMTYEDNIRFQHALCKSLGVERLFAYIGFSMGGQQAYYMSALFPEFVENMVCLAGSARTSSHNWVILEGLKYTLIHSGDFKDGLYTAQASKVLMAFDRVYCPWALSQEFFRKKCWEELGFGSLEGYLEEQWSGSGDANDLLCLLWTWQNGDITLLNDGDEVALERIKARCLVMPSRTDRFFPVEDSVEEVKFLEKGEMRVIESVFGHLAGGGFGTRGDTEFISGEIRRFLNSA
jgi:homoserine acetyltransferase